MLEEICTNTEAFIVQMPKEQRKQYGQFFTSIETARFMASLLTIDSEKNEVYALDAGAGTGVLSVALIERCCKVFTPSQTLHLTCYENDPNVLPLLKSNLSFAKQHCTFCLEYNIIEKNYILSQKDLLRQNIFSTEAPACYDLIIGNPPYKKISKDAPEALSLPMVCHGAPNLYFLFATMGIENLKQEAEMVYIIPRSWTSGAYFEKFRKFLLKHTRITYIHLFKSRNKVFDKESVLQETMIVRLKKTHEPVTHVTISTSESSKNFCDIRKMDIPYHIVVSSNHSYVHLVTDEEEMAVLEKINKLGKTLPDLGLKMKTGLVVDFRTQELLRNSENADTIPLIYSQHIKDGRVKFPQGKENEYILKKRRSLMQENRNYLFLKRFTAKEERRRLQCGIYLKRYLPKCTFISSQNKVNFIDGLQGLSECVVYGLYVIFNSTLYDIYYRILNGSTQVNSTEINSMPLPSLKIIEAMGKQLIQNKDLSEQNCNQILNRYVHE